MLARFQRGWVVQLPCPQCERPLGPRQRRHCGANECRRAYHAERQSQFQHAHQARAGTSYRNRFARQPAPLREHTCCVCGRRWTSRRYHAVYCSTICQTNGEWARKIGNRQPATRRTRALRQLARAARGTRAQRRWIAGPCASCGTQFTTLGTAPRFCALACQQRERKARRRARQAGGDVERADRLTVFERDDWTCQLCDHPTDRDARVPTRNAPTIDHRIPLAAGGSHTLANLQTAHFYCNSVKGARHTA